LGRQEEHDAQDRAPLRLDRGQDRQTFATGTARGQRLLWQATPQPEAKHADDDAKQEGDAPAPRAEHVRGHHVRYQRAHGRAEQDAANGAHRHPATIPAAMLGIRVLDDIDD
jgi:hypothetical protein